MYRESLNLYNKFYAFLGDLTCKKVKAIIIKKDGISQ